MTPTTILRTNAGVYWLFGLTGVTAPGIRDFYLPHVDKLYVFTRKQLNERN